MANKVSVDLLMDIFSRLPVESLLVIRSVCKLWYTIIQNPSFNFSTRLSHATKYTLFQFNNTSDPQAFSYSLRDINQAFDHEEAYNEYFHPQKSGFSNPSALGVYGICDGLICLSDKQLGLDAAIYLWNPCIRKVKRLPQSMTTPLLEVDYSYYISLVFGRCKGKDKDFKVVKMISVVAKRGVVKSLYRIEVYSLRTNAWKIIRDSMVEPFPAYYFVYNGFAKVVNGCAFWISEVRDKIDRTKMRNIVVYFDMDGEVFREIELPVTTRVSRVKYFQEILKLKERREGMRSMSIEALGDSLALFVLNGTDYNVSSSFDMWVLKDCCMKEKGDDDHECPWIKKATFMLQPGEYDLSLGFRSMDELLVLKTGTYPRYAELLSRIDPFVESLVLIDERPDLEEGRRGAAEDGFVIEPVTHGFDKELQSEVKSMAKVSCYFINLTSCSDHMSSLKCAEFLLPHMYTRLLKRDYQQTL